MNIRAIASFALASVLAFAASGAFAQDAGSAAQSKSGKPLTAQQMRMKNCNAEAKSQALKGDERKAFMSTCLKSQGKAIAANGDDKPAPSPAQITRKACGDEAKSQGLKGEERKEFVRNCVREDRLSRTE